MAEQHSSDGQPSEFFAINARYIFDPKSSIEGLMNDAGCLLEAGLDALETETDSLRGSGWAALYTLRQAKAVLNEFLSRLPADAIDAIRAQDKKLSAS